MLSKVIEDMIDDSLIKLSDDELSCREMKNQSRLSTAVAVFVVDINDSQKNTAFHMIGV